VFEPYGASHWAAIALLAVGAALLTIWGRRHRDTKTAVVVSRAFALAIVVVVVLSQIQLVLYRQWDLQSSVPLHLCDLAGAAAAYALWSHRRWAFALTYYWGLTLTSQAFLTPTLDSADFPHLEFLMFWYLHLLVVWAAIYLTWGLGMRPNWRSYAIAVTVTVVWGLAMLAFNHLAGTNYGFVSAKPAGPTILDLLGDWPWYLFSELALGAAVWALITWPWVARQRPSGVPPDLHRVGQRAHPSA